MYVLFLVLNKTEYLDDILSAFVEIGVKGATILDSQGMGSALAYNGNEQFRPFGFLKDFLDSSRPYNKTIFTVLESKELVKKVTDTVNDILGDIKKPGIGLMFTVKVDEIFGMR